GVVVRGNGLRIAVYDDRFKAQLFEREGGMHAAVVKLDTLSDAVRTAAQNHDLRLIGAHRIFIRGVVGGVVVSAVRRSAHMYALPGFGDAESESAGTDCGFGNLQKLA